MLKSIKTQADICILDGSFTSCVTAWLLAKQGVRVRLLQPQPHLCHEMQNRIPFFWPSLNDPPTRAVVAHGLEVAQFLNDFCQRGVELFEEHFFKLLGNDQAVKVTSVERIGFEDYEVTELSQAVELNLLKRKQADAKLFIEHGFGFYVHQRALLSIIEKCLTAEKLITLQRETAVKVEKPGDVCRVSLKDDQIFSCEMVLCNDETLIRELFPNFKDVLVPMSDVVLHTSLQPLKKMDTLALRSSNGHAAGCVAASQMGTDVWLSGPRFLLPQAGANLLLPKTILTDELKQRLLNFHRSHLLNEFAAQLKTQEMLSKVMEPKTWEASLDYDYWPCDEMPLLGELGLAGRALGSAGWLATSLSAGMAAAHVLADFVLTGKNQSVHPLLSPRRLFIG